MQVSLAPPYAVDDATFKKLVAILRIAVPYTGMILRCDAAGRQGGRDDGQRKGFEAGRQS